MARWTDVLLSKKHQTRGNKFNAKMTECPKGHGHRSAAEASLCATLHWMEKAGEIENIRTEQSVFLSEARIRYIADFVVYDKKLGGDVWHECKGKEMPRWQIVKKLWRVYGPGKLRVWKGSAARLTMVEEINGST